MIWLEKAILFENKVLRCSTLSHLLKKLALSHTLFGGFVLREGKRVNNLHIYVPFKKTQIKCDKANFCVRYKYI